MLVRFDIRIGMAFTRSSGVSRVCLDYFSIDGLYSRNLNQRLPLVSITIEGLNFSSRNFDS